MAGDFPEYEVIRLSEPERVMSTDEWTTLAWRKPKAYSLEQFFALGYTRYQNIPFSRVHPTDENHAGLGYHGYVAQERHDEAHIQSERARLSDYAHDIVLVQSIVTEDKRDLIDKDKRYLDNHGCYLSRSQRQRLRCHKTKEYANRLYSLGWTYKRPQTVQDTDCTSGQAYTRTIPRTGLEYELGWVNESIEDTNALPSQTKTEKTPCGFVIPRQFNQATYERTRQAAIIQHQDKEGCDAVLDAAIGWSKSEPTELLRTILGDLIQEAGYGARVGLKHDGDGRGRVAIQLMRKYTDPIEHKHHSLTYPLWVTRDLQGLAQLYELAEKYPSVFCAYGSPCVTFLGKRHTIKNMQHLGGFYLDIDDVTPRKLKDMLRSMDDGTIPTPSFVATSRSGVHLFFDTHEICKHDGGKREGEFAGAFGVGSGTAKARGLAIVKSSIESVYNDYCGKAKGIDHLTLSQLVGFPGTPTKQMSSEIKNGYDYYGDVIQKYTLFKSQSTHDETSIASLLGHDCIARAVHAKMTDAILTGKGLPKKSRHQLSNAVSRRDFVTKTLGIDMTTPECMRDTIMSIARGWVVKNGNKSVADDGRTIIDALAVDEAALMLIGLSDPVMFMEWQDGIRTHVGGRTAQKRRLDKRNIRNTYRDPVDGEDRDIDERISNSYYFALYHRPSYITQHRQVRYHEYVKALHGVLCGARAKSIHELALAGIACNMRLSVVVSDAYELMEHWNEQDPLDDMDWHELTEEELVSALVLHGDEGSGLFNWRVAYSISEIGDLYPTTIGESLTGGKPGRKHGSKVDAIIVRLGDDTSPKEVASIAGVDISTVYRRLRILNLRKSARMQVRKSLGSEPKLFGSDRDTSDVILSIMADVSSKGHASRVSSTNCQRLTMRARARNNYGLIIGVDDDRTRVRGLMPLAILDDRQVHVLCRAGPP